MRKLLGLLTALVAVFALQLATFDHSADARRYRTRALVGVGIAALAVGAIAASSSRAHARPRYSCAYLHRRCYEGSNWACNRFDAQC